MAIDLEKVKAKYQGKGLPHLPRLGYDGDESIYFDRTKPSVVDGEPFFEECDPEEVCAEIERDAIQLADEVERQGKALSEAQSCINTLNLVTSQCAQVPCTEKLMGNCGECVACRARIFEDQRKENDHLQKALEKIAASEALPYGKDRYVGIARAALPEKKERSEDGG